MGHPRFFDLHCDTITREPGVDPANSVYCLETAPQESRAEEMSLVDNGFHIDLHKLPEEWDWCQTFALFIPDEYRGQRAIDYFGCCAAVFRSRMEAHGDLIRQVRTPEELEGVLAEGKRAAILSVEGGAALGGRIEMLDRLWEEGVQMMTLT